MQKGDLVKGTPAASRHYGITTEKMTKAVVREVRGKYIVIKILEHEGGSTGEYMVEAEYFEVIGHLKPFNRDEVLVLLRDGCKEALIEYDLEDANLSDADLSGADLSGAYLSKANLSNADLSGANLSKANLSEANLYCADLSEANLTEANLSRANLDKADLEKADLSKANLSKADLSGADLSDANLSKADLSGADLWDARLQKANCQDANFDFSCLPLWCGSFGIQCDKRFAAQVAYHFCRLDCEDEEVKAAQQAIKGLANQFHRLDECGAIE